MSGDGHVSQGRSPAVGAEPALPMLSTGPCSSSVSVPGVGRPAARASCRWTGFFPTWRLCLLSCPLYRWQATLRPARLCCCHTAGRSWSRCPAPLPPQDGKGAFEGLGGGGAAGRRAHGLCAGSMHGLGGLEAEMGFSWTLISSGKTAPEPHLGKPHPSLTFRV